VADNLTDVAEARTLNWLTGNTTTAPTLPLMVRLLTALGSDAAAGTEVVNAGGSTYTPQSAAFPASSGTGGNTANSADIVCANMPACTVVGLEIWDSAATPFRWWQGPAVTPKAVGLGETIRILAGQLTLTVQ
jgi:hypothetical protein